MKAVLLISHGSRSPKTKREVAGLVRKLKRQTRIKILEYAFLELESPDIPKGIEQCVKKGATKVIILLNFLNSGRHVDKDIPAIVRKAKKKYKRVSFQITKPVGQHQRIVGLFRDLIS